MPGTMRWCETRRALRHTGAPRMVTGGRRWVAELCVVLAVWLAAAVAGAAPARASESDERALAERFAPAVQLVRQDVECGPGEPYRPSDVDAVLGNEGVALRGPWSQDDLVKIAPTGDDLSRGLAGYHLDLPGNPLDPGCDYEQWARTAAERAPAHGVCPRRDGGRPGRPAGPAVLVLLPVQRLQQQARKRLGDGPARVRGGRRGAGAGPGPPRGRLQPARGRRGGSLG